MISIVTTLLFKNNSRITLVATINERRTMKLHWTHKGSVLQWLWFRFWWGFFFVENNKNSPPSNCSCSSHSRVHQPPTHLNLTVPLCQHYYVIYFSTVYLSKFNDYQSLFKVRSVASALFSTALIRTKIALV